MQRASGKLLQLQYRFDDLLDEFCKLS